MLAVAKLASDLLKPELVDESSTVKKSPCLPLVDAVDNEGQLNPLTD